MRTHMDVFFSNFGITGCTAAVIDIVKAWDGTFYAETNAKELCGPNRLVYAGNAIQPASVDWVMLNAPAHMRDER